LRDDSTFVKHPNGFVNKDDWRRNNVNLLIKTIYDSIRLAKPHMKFGISPFGVWRNLSEDPQGSDTRAGIPLTPSVCRFQSLVAAGYCRLHCAAKLFQHPLPGG
jgi:hypothetical protein